MADKEPKRNVLGSSVSGIPTRSRLPTPAIRTQRSASSLIPSPGPTTSSFAPRPPPLPTQSTSARGNAATGTSKPTTLARPTVLTSKASSSSLRPQKSNGSLRPSPVVRPPVPSPSAPRSVRPGTITARVAPSPRSPRPPASPNKTTESRAAASEPSPENGFSSSSSISLKEQIAARRAAMKKGLASSTSTRSHASTATATTRAGGSNFSNSTLGGSGFSDWASSAGPDDSPMPHGETEDAEDLLGRPTVRQAVIKALNTGSLNLMSRQLTSLPTSLFTLHLGITPAPLSNGSSDARSPLDDTPSGVNRWEAMDLSVLKAGDNEIAEIQEELGLFGALKSVEFQKNKLMSLPAGFAQLACLTHLDISHCLFTSVPSILSTLPALVQLNISHNALTSLSFSLPTASDLEPPKSASPRRDEFLYSPSSPLADHPFPALQTLLASNNKLKAAHIGPIQRFPSTLLKLDLNHNPVSDTRSSSHVTSLLEALACLPSLKEIHMRSSGLVDGAIANLSLTSGTAAFPKLKALDIGDNDGLTEECVRHTFLASRESSDIRVGTHMDVIMASSGSSSASRGPAIRLVIGRHVVKEAWEIEMERRGSSRKEARNTSSRHSGQMNGRNRAAPEDEADEGFGFGRKETRVRRNAAASGRVVPHQDDAADPYPQSHGRSSAGTKYNTDPSLPASSSQPAPSDHPVSDAATVSSGGSSGILTLDKYYDEKTRTLMLPAAVPQTRRGAAHARSQSLYTSPGTSGGHGIAGDIIVPPQTFPHSLIVNQSWATSIRTLVLSNRRTDVSFLLSTSFALGGHDDLSSSHSEPSFRLPSVEELRLDGCQLPSRIKINCQSPSTSSSTTLGVSNTSISGDLGSNSRGDAELHQEAISPMKEMDILPTLHRIFPALGSLDLSYNALTTLKGVGEMFIPSSSASDETGSGPDRGGSGLKVLRVRGNKIDEAALGELVRIGECFKLGDAGMVAEWHGVEIDLRENEIGKLPGLLGWLPLEILLVESNAFRVPSRRLWEREGTKGLLAFLRAVQD